MFQVAIIEDKAVRILPHCLALSQLEAITQQLELTYIDKARPGWAWTRRARCGAVKEQAQALRLRRGRVLSPFYDTPLLAAAPGDPRPGLRRHSVRNTGRPGRHHLPAGGRGAVHRHLQRGAPACLGETAAALASLPRAPETDTPPQVVFRPFVGEVLRGKIVSADRRGLQVCEPWCPPRRTGCPVSDASPNQVSLGFFNDVFIPGTALQEPSSLCVPRASSNGWAAPQPCSDLLIMLAPSPATVMRRSTCGGGCTRETRCTWTWTRRHVGGGPIASLHPE
jgi:hypothetical protein